VVRSHIGYGSPKQDVASAHGAPLGAEALAATREQLGCSYGPFEIPPHAYDHWHAQVDERRAAHVRWQAAFDRYRDEHPALADEYERRMAGRLPEGWAHGLAAAVASDGPVATRRSLGAARGLRLHPRLDRAR
jgi:transketolase